MQIWNLNQVNSTSSAPVRSNYSLVGHESGVNCIDYHKGDKPYLLSGADDRYFSANLFDRK